jgi:hypothetical protein
VGEHTGGAMDVETMKHSVVDASFRTGYEVLEMLIRNFTPCVVMEALLDILEADQQEVNRFNAELVKKYGQEAVDELKGQ